MDWITHPVLLPYNTVLHLLPRLLPLSPTSHSFMVYLGPLKGSHPWLLWGQWYHGPKAQSMFTSHKSQV